jgi:hypothetical protein
MPRLSLPLDDGGQVSCVFGGEGAAADRAGISEALLCSGLYLRKPV